MANDNEYSDKVWFMASYRLVPFFSTIWRFCVLILSPIRISFATPTKIVSMFLTIQFHPSTACLIVARLSVWRLFFGIFWFLLFSTIWEPELETRFVCMYSISPHFLDALSSGHKVFLSYNSSQAKHEIIHSHDLLLSLLSTVLFI